MEPLLVKIVLVTTTLFFAYLLGSFNTSIIFSSLVKKINIRNVGTKNPGATNISRLFGFKTGLLIWFIDNLKPFVNIAFLYLLSSKMIKKEDYNEYELIQFFLFYSMTLFTILGHCYPFFFKYKGGKGVSITFSWILIFNFYYAIVFFVVWWITIFIEKKASFASLFSLTWLVILIFGTNLFSFNNSLIENHNDWMFKLVFKRKEIYNFLYFFSSFVIAVVNIFVLHRKNLRRLFLHQEKNILWVLKT